MRRRRLLGLTATVGIAGMAGCTVQTGSESSQRDGPTVSLAPVVTELDFPTAMAFLPDGGALISERDGRIVRHEQDGSVDRVLDLRDELASLSAERGMLGLALHPDFPDPPSLYVRYSAPDRSGEHAHFATLSEFQVSEDGSRIDQDTERRILEVPQPGDVHNAGDIAFGPDGYLYVPFGDGQMINPDSNEGSWWYDRGQTAQNTRDNLLGGILRIDINREGANRPYGIPEDNPLVGQEGRDEYFAWGLRNPYRISFDEDELYIANVGAHLRESVYLGEKGANYGWPNLEGSTCSPTTQASDALSDSLWNIFDPKTWVAQFNRISPSKVCPSGEARDTDFIPPVIEYFRTSGRAITGGYVYRGTDLSSLAGQYLFGDLRKPAPLFAATPRASADTPWPIEELVVQGTTHGRVDADLISFARDASGELYVLTTDYAEGTGQVARLVPAP